jgi:hypothetical protein
MGTLVINFLDGKASTMRSVIAEFNLILIKCIPSGSITMSKKNFEMSEVLSIVESFGGDTHGNITISIDGDMVTIFFIEKKLINELAGSAKE